MVLVFDKETGDPINQGMADNYTNFKNDVLGGISFVSHLIDDNFMEFMQFDQMSNSLLQGLFDETYTFVYIIDQESGINTWSVVDADFDFNLDNLEMAALFTVQVQD